MIMGGCKSDRGDTAAVGDAKTIISSSDYGDIGDVLKLAPRKVDNDDAEAALKAIGLWEDSSRVSWDSRTGEAGRYNFKDVKITAKDGKDITAKGLTLGGLHMEGDTPMVDVVDFSGLAINDDDTSLTIEHLGLTNLPLSQNLSAISEIDDLLDVSGLDLKTDEDLKGPDSVVFKGITGTADNAIFEIDTLGWGQDPKDQHIRFAAEDIMIKVDEDNGPITVRLASAKMRGLEPANPTASEAIGDIKSQNGFLNLLMKNPQVGDMTIKGLDIQSDIFTLDLPSLEQSAKKKGSVTSVNANMLRLYGKR